MNAEYRKEYENWCNSSVFDEATRKELLALTDEKEIEDRFYKPLSFGTGGLRGEIGAGINRMNVYTVGKATQGLADFINSQQTTGQGSVVIAYDSRNMSPEFALCSALVLCANGIETYLFESLRPTPELSFAVRYLSCTAGIVITASHNPPAYNGYKVYWKDGGQIVAPYDKEIIARVNAIESFSQIQRMDKEQALERGLLHIIGKEVDDQYIEAVKKTVVCPEILREMAKEIKIVYTPLHGTGNIPVRRALKELGFEQVWVVPEQELPDGNFSTLEYPNPEDVKAFSLALRLARKKDADVVLATDPDADRLGIFAKDDKTGEYIPFTGNMSGLLIAEYRLSQLKAKEKLPNPASDGALITTIVSSNMAFDVAREYGLTAIEVLTGFKYIGEQMKLFEEAKAANGGKTDASKYAYEYLFGFEESYGCLVGTHARDKDAIAAVIALCEAAAYYKKQGVTLCEQMKNMYEKYGYYRESLESVTLRGIDGAEKMEGVMRNLRETPPTTLGGLRVLAVRDYEKGIRTDVLTDEQTQTGLPQSNVLYYELEENGWCCVRPSGTEPKIKFYFGVKAKSVREAEEQLEKIK
ncbi:MAG: phospho-sugar mutase, partial [Clostridia bacterium]|nr:phospho-sugar mutase [Clostridia bacterium]